MSDSDKRIEETETKEDENRRVIRQNVKDCVDEWGYESFPASDPPSYGSSYRRRMREEAEEENKN